MILIRKAVASDAEAINYLDKEWEKEGISWALAMSPTAVERIKKEIKKDFFYVAEYKGAVVGYVYGFVKTAVRAMPSYSIEKGQKYGEIESLYVLKEHRNKMAGGKLVKRILSEFKEKDVAKVKLWTSHKNVWKIVRFYRRFGFQERHVDMVLDLK